jgi:hypothetical protein
MTDQASILRPTAHSRAALGVIYYKARGSLAKDEALA